MATFSQGDASASGHIIISVLSFWFGKERKRTCGMLLKINITVIVIMMSDVLS